MVIIDIIALIIIYIVLFFLSWRKKTKNVLILNTITYIYIGCVIYITLMPLISGIPHILDHPYTPMNMKPFIDAIEGWGDYERQIILNIIMTIPYGILVPLVLRNKKCTLVLTVGSCFLFSFLIEVIQPVISSTRSSDITDIITNTIGGIIGYIIYLIIKPILIKIFRLEK